MKKIVLLLVLLVAGVGHADELQEFGDQMSNFYLNPTEAAFVEFQHKANRLEAQLTSSQSKAGILVAVMAARISEKHHWPLQETFFRTTSKEILAGKSRLAQFINDDAAVTPAKLDIWWASYFATGEEKYLDKLLRFAGEKMPEDDAARLLVVGAATWSFKANCRQHRSIRAFALQRAKDKSLSAHKQKYLKECAQAAEEKSS